MYTYKGTVLSVYDGDTITVRLDLGFKISTEVKLRLVGIDTPELRGGTEETKAAARAARDHVRSRVSGVEVRVQTTKKGKYGRWLGVVWIADDSESLNDELIRLNHATPYSGGKRG